MSQSRVHRLSRRRILSGVAAGAVAVGAGTLFPGRRGWANARTVHKHADLEAIVVSDGHFVLPTGLLVAPDSPIAEREAALRAAGQTGDQFQLVNNVVVIRRQSDLILVDAGTGPRHQPTAGKLAENLKAANIQPADVTTAPRQGRRNPCGLHQQAARPGRGRAAPARGGGAVHRLCQERQLQAIWR